jgi:hypothetical protein
VLYALGPGPLMLYMGQEVGEPALGDQGFGGTNARTSIFDYGACPELARWFNGGRCDGGLLTPEQRALRAWLRELLALVKDPVFEHGATWPLNGGNVTNEAFGRLPGESASGHWLYAFARSHEERAFVVAANFHPTVKMRETRAWLGDDLIATLAHWSEGWTLSERLMGEHARDVSLGDLRANGLALPELPPLSAVALELTPRERSTCPAQSPPG